jgi:UDP-N-acetylmuramoyl-L-alanyl-D-glutamate--2,6-diaminopimelate ligase
MKTIRDIFYGVHLTEVHGSTDVVCDRIVFDSRHAGPGCVFVALKGATTDGHEFIAKVIENGCTSIVCEQAPIVIPEAIHLFVVKSTHEALGQMAANFYDHPSSKLKLIGITGTNGKTTTTTLLYDLFRKLGYKAGLISTVVNKIADELIPSTHTTPDPVTLNELLQKMVDAGCDYCFMEVSSHAVHQRRIVGLDFAVAGFTNISRDHLDYHKTFQEYIHAKKAFFDDLKSSAVAISNIDDKNGLVMMQNTKASQRTYGMKSMADYKVKVMENLFSGLVLQLDGIEVWTRLIGDFNAYNLLLVYAAARELGQDKDEVLRILSTLESVEGRFEYTQTETGVMGIVDYAHTPDALDNVLKTIKNIRTGNETVFTVVGCGGDRDKGKRPEMAKIACEGSDRVVLTSDNPRSEDPDAIIEDMMTGVEGQYFKKVLAITNRREAIKTVCSMAESGDIILIAGKGHETYQEIKGVKHDFDDMEILKELMIKLNK